MRWIPIARLDCRLQRRYGFYFAASFIAVVWIVILRFMRPEVLPLAVPFIVFVDLAVVGFYFMAGALLFEKSERTLQALLVSPLRFREYLASKLLTLTLLAMIVSLAVAVVGYGPHFNLFFFLTGVALTSLLTLLVGLIAVAPYDSISRFLIPAQFYMLILYAPLAHFFGWWTSPMIYLIPTQGSLLMLRGAFRTIRPWQTAYATLYQLLWLVALTVLARRRFDRHIAGRRGAT
jgi:fluoroquinolone transport system permease protein